MSQPSYTRPQALRRRYRRRLRRRGDGHVGLVAMGSAAQMPTPSTDSALDATFSTNLGGGFSGNVVGGRPGEWQSRGRWVIHRRQQE